MAPGNCMTPVLAFCRPVPPLLVTQRFFADAKWAVCAPREPPPGAGHAGVPCSAVGTVQVGRRRE